MTVKIKKEPREVTIEELKKMDEFDEIRITLNPNKIAEFERKWGMKCDYPSNYKIKWREAELGFTEHYMDVDNGYKKIPYEFIKKIEVVEL